MLNVQLELILSFLFRWKRHFKANFLAQNHSPPDLFCSFLTQSTCEHLESKCGAFVLRGAPAAGKRGKTTMEGQEGASRSSVFPHPRAPLWSPSTWKKRKETKQNKRRRGVLPPSNVREVAASESWSWLAMNGTWRPDWWRGLGVRRSASGSDKTADCFSSTDYSNLDVQKGPAWQAGCCWSACGGDDARGWGFFFCPFAFVKWAKDDAGTFVQEEIQGK